MPNCFSLTSFCCYPHHFFPQSRIGKHNCPHSRETKVPHKPPPHLSHPPTPPPPACRWLVGVGDTGPGPENSEPGRPWWLLPCPGRRWALVQDSPARAAGGTACWTVHNSKSHSWAEGTATCSCKFRGLAWPQKRAEPFCPTYLGQESRAGQGFCTQREAENKHLRFLPGAPMQLPDPAEGTAEGGPVTRPLR